ncbi:hypothetical protein [Pseudomonas aeruginosa]|uniref:hypothetical protein n=1 Tax=Pseudomonas aeruginosa TaxID=287 RepID=UPI0012987955|nr:hypothetical protein [Pseudomonas aeruginosa]
MSEVKRFDHVNHAHVDECEHIENPEGAWVKAYDYDALVAEAQALREEVAQQKFLTKVENDALKMMTDKANELKSEVEQLEEELESLRARVVVVQDWQPLTAVGQVEIGDLLRFTVGGKEIEAPAVLVIAPGDPKEEIIYNRGKNHYFITSMAVDGTSSHKNVMVKRPSGKTVSEDLLRRIERECRRESDWNCENVPAGTNAATTRAKKMLEIASDLRDLLGEQEGGRQ